MPAYAQVPLKGTSGLVTYTVEADGTLLLSLDDLARVEQAPYATHKLLARVVEALEKRISAELSQTACEPWIIKDREVWELQRWEPLGLGWGSLYPGHLYPTDPGRWTSRDQRRSTMSFDPTGWRLDPTVVCPDGWSYAIVPQTLRSVPTLHSWSHRWVRWRRWVPDVPCADVEVRPTPWGDHCFCQPPVFAAVLWLATGGGDPPYLLADPLQLEHEIEIDLEIVRRCWGRTAQVATWRQQLGVDDLRTTRDNGGRSRARKLSSSDAERALWPLAPRAERGWRSRVVGALGAALAVLRAPLRVAGGAAARVRGCIGSVAFGALALALLWRCGALWRLASCLMACLASWGWHVLAVTGAGAVTSGLLIAWLRLPVSRRSLTRSSRGCHPVHPGCDPPAGMSCLQAYVGWLFSFAVTRWGLHGHPLRARTLHVSPYVQPRPWRLQLRVHAEDFGFGNPPGDRRRPSRACNPMHCGLKPRASQPAARR